MNENLNDEIYLQKSLERELNIMKLIKGFSFFFCCFCIKYNQNISIFFFNLGLNIVNLLDIIKTKKQTYLIFEFCN